MRAKEVERLKACINNAPSYEDKLRFLFNTKGFIPDRTAAVWDNDDAEPIINLRPETTEQRKVFNKFVIEDFKREYGTSMGFTPAYHGFDYEKERQRLNQRLRQPSTDKPALLLYIKSQIENHFGYPESLHTDTREKHINRHVIQQIDLQLEQMGHIHHQFARLCFGETIDPLSVTGLDSYSLLNYTHVLEIFKLYDYVKQLIEKPEHLSKVDFSNTMKKDNQSDSKESKLPANEIIKDKEQMITESVENLFSFINYLHSKTEYLLSKQNLVDKVMELVAIRNSLKPNQHYRDRIEYNKIQVELEEKFDTLKKETTNIIVDKIQELSIADISTPIINLNAHGDLFQLQRNFSEIDLALIFDAKRKYIEFRTKTKFHYFLEFFFYDLDRDLKEFFDYFKETTENGFEAFETKTIQVNSFHEAVEQFQKGNKQVTLPFDLLYSPIAQQNNPQTFRLPNPKTQESQKKNGTRKHD